MGSRTRVLKIGQNVRQLAQCFHITDYKSCDWLLYRKSPDRRYYCTTSHVILYSYCTGSHLTGGIIVLQVTCHQLIVAGFVERNFQSAF